MAAVTDVGVEDPVAAGRGRTVQVRGTSIRVVPPTLRDPRVHVAAVIVSVQALGQVVIGFDVSVAQILLTIGVCVAIEIPMVLWERGVLSWPASALLTGNGIALLLRTPGTEHGDWWSLNGWPVFVAAAVIAMTSKYAVRVDGRHLFNPSNLGLVAVFLLFGSTRADPQDLWWGPWTPGLVATVVLIVVGGLTLSRRLGLGDVVAGFWLVFAAGIGVLAVSGHEITARWSLEPVAGFDYWLTLVASPEIIIFVFFMITDPKTMPITRPARGVYAVGVAVLAALLAATQTAEYGTKVALLGALTIVCMTRPLLERLIPEWQVDRSIGDRARRAAVPAMATVVVFAAALVGTQALAGGGSVEAGSGDGVVVAPREAGERPAVSRPDAPLPEPTVRATVTETVAGFESETAAGIVRDVVEDLAIESMALSTGDAEMAATAVFGPRLARVEGWMAENAAAGRVEEHRYDFEAFEVVLLRDPVSPQAIPQLGVEVVATETAVFRSGPIGEPLGPDATSPYHRVLLVSRVGDHFLIGDDMAPDAGMVVVES